MSEQLKLGMKIPVEHRGFWPDRIKPLTQEQLDKYFGHDHGAIERGLAEEWEHNNTQWGISLQDLLWGAAEHKKLPPWFDPEVTPRDARLVADVIQWLGTNCGLSFLHQAFRRAGYSFHYEELGREERLRAEAERFLAEVALEEQRERTKALNEIEEFACELRNRRIEV